MSFNSNKNSVEQLPEVTTFQFSNDAVGQVKESVNLFTGTANIPVNIASFTGRKDLDVNIGIMYNSNVQNNVKNWNLLSPTGILGLGWDMYLDKISVNKNGSGSRSSDEYFLLNNGSGNQLIQDGILPSNPSDILLFQLRNFEFWDVSYDATNEKWTIIKEDGTVHIYGDKNSGRNTLQYGVEWGNWQGATSVLSGQEQYVSSWNLSEIRNTWGESILYSYDNVEVSVGDKNGLKYTQASYIKTIKDSFDRTISFNYGEKFGANNVSSQNIIEYKALHTEKDTPNAYQDQYETRFLDFIEVYNNLDILQFSILFEYDFINLGINSQNTIYPLMWKRVLKSFWQVQPTGNTLPGMEFDYYDKVQDTYPGALKSILYPQGSKAVYTYKDQALNTARNVKLDSPMVGATPRVWFGSDYTVVTWYNKTTKKLIAKVHTWSGNWIDFELNSDDPSNHYFDNVVFDIDTLGVITKQDFIGIYFTEKSKKQLQLFLYRRNQENFGVFNLTNGPQYFPLKTDTSKVSVESGKDFVIVSSKDITTNPITAFQWNWKQRIWSISPSNQQGGISILLPLPSDVLKANNIAINARDNYYITTLYNTSSKLLQFQLFYYNGNNVWSKSALYNTPNVTIYQNPSEGLDFAFNITLNSSFAVATYITSQTSTEVDYTLRILQWDKNFNLLSAGSPLLNNYKSPIENGNSQFKIFNTLLTDALVANNPYLNRYTGGFGNNNNPINWKQTLFITQPNDIVSFAVGQDISVMSKEVGQTNANQYFQFNPNTGTWGIVQNLPSTGEKVTIGGNYMTVGKDIFYQNTEGKWIKQKQELTNLGATETVQNRGSIYVAYQDNRSSNAQTYFATPLNSIPGVPMKLPLTSGETGQKIVVDQETVRPGTLLAGTDAFVTFPSNQDFDTATSIALYKVVDGKATDIVQVQPVSYIEISNGSGLDEKYYQSYDYKESAQSIITYNGRSGLAQFPKVTVFTGTKITDPSLTTNGITINYFSNGVATQNEIPYTNWIYNYNQLLNGALLQKTQFDKDGNRVTNETSYWEIFSNDVVQKRYLYSAYFRLSKSVALRDGVSQTSSVAYYQKIGLPMRTVMTYFDSNGEEKTITNEKKYAVQVSEYATAMQQKHYLNALAQESISVTGKDGIEKYISSKIVTWKNWSTNNEWKWSAYQNYNWLDNSKNNPVFDFSAAQNNPDWLKKQEILTRGAFDTVDEMMNVDGVSSSYIYDKSGQFQVAEFIPASRAGEEASFYSFETYEKLDGWNINSNASIIPNATDKTIDARIGVSSLKITKGTGIERQFNPTNQQQDYVFSSYIKLPDTFDKNKGEANWIITFSSNGNPVGNNIILPFGETIGTWQYVYCLLNLKDYNPTGADKLITITIKAQNDNSEAAVLTDCLRFSPLQSLFSAISVDTNIDLINESLGSNGEIRSKFFDSHQRVMATTSFSDETTSIATNYFSRTGNDNKFSDADPNNKFKVLSAGGGPALSFTKGNQWKEFWTPNDASAWQVENGILNFTPSSSEGILTYKEAMTNNYGVMLNLSPLETINKVLGIKIGNQFTVQWDPSIGEWQLLDENNQILQQKRGNVTEINTDASSKKIDSTSLKSKLLRSGFYLNLESNAIENKNDGIYDKKNQRYYALHKTATALNVSYLESQWFLLVNENSILFFADGVLIFNYINDSIISGKPALFAKNAIGINSLLTSFDNLSTLTFVNGAGNDIQSQLLDNTRMTIVENIYNSRGLVLANTKPAFVEGNQQNPLFIYSNNFATYNCQNGIMSGLIANFYPDDEGYPYFGYQYERSPLSRVLEKSMPGAAYKLGTNTQRFIYDANNGNLGLPLGEYFKTTIIDQNGNQSYSLADKRGQEVRKVSQKNVNEDIVSAVFYDDLGNPIAMHSPNAMDRQTDRENWINYSTYNFIGQLITTKSNTSGTTEMIYDRASRLRFRQDAEANEQGNYQYYKYDNSGRIIETGYITDTWDRNDLQEKANNNLEYPVASNTWRLKTSYDYDGTNAPFQVGQVVQTLNNHSDNGVADVEENFAYDIYGNVIVKNQKVLEFENEYYTTNFKYNNLGGILKIDYPVQKNKAAYSIYYAYNSIGQIEGISNSPTSKKSIAAYTYNPAGKPEQETLYPTGNHPVTRNYGYNSPVWLDSMEDLENNNDQIFNEILKTDASSLNGPKYFNGQSAEIAFQYPKNIKAGSTYTNWYNSLNALEKVDETSSYISPRTRLYDFDNNGNFDTISIDAHNYKFIAEPNKGDRLQKVDDTATNASLFNLSYNQNGAVQLYKASGADGYAPQNLSFNYDAGNRLTSMIEDLASLKNYKFYYNSSNDRVLKQETSGKTIESTTLYVKSLSGNPLVQIRRKENTEDTIYMVYGPIGIISFVKNDNQYTTLKDHLGSVRVILDDKAAVAAAYDYDIYGNVNVLTEPEEGFFPYLYTSQEYDFELGIYNYKARFYFSRVGRFGVIDNYNQFFSPYIYAGNSPIVYIDPSGNFSMGNFFSAIGGAIIGAFEILIGVAIDAVAGFLEVVTGGLSTPVSIGLAALAGGFIGSGVSAVSYSAVSLVTNDFSWKEYGINTAIGFAVGAISGGFGAAGVIAAEAATGVKAAADAGQAVSTLAKVANAGIKAGFAITGAEVAGVSSTLINNGAHGMSLTTGLDEALVKGVLSSTLSWAVPGIDYKAGWGNLFARISANVAKSEGIGVSIQLGSNAVHGNSFDTGLMNTVIKGFVGGSIGALGTKSYAKEKTTNVLNSMGLGAPKNPVPADGIIRL
jgi:RHS repeat-associated protein